MSHDLNISEHSSTSFPEHDPRARESRLADDQDPFFVFDFRAVDGPSNGGSDGCGDDSRRWSNYWDVERLCRGPEPVPDWVVTDRAAIDTDLGVLKTGKEADVFLLDRGVDGDPEQTVVMAVKRYRTEEHRSFHRSGTYTEGRRTRNSRDARAMAKKTEHGRAVASGQWAWAEWESLKRFWSAGIPVPYPVQIDGTEILMEFISVDGEAAPRLAQTRPAPDLLTSYFDQCVRRWQSLPDTGSHTATCRRTTSWPAATGSSSSTCPRLWTSSATRRAWTS